MKKLLVLFLVLVSAILLTACNGTLQVQVALEPAQAQTRLGKLAFITGGDVWTLDLDGGQSTRLTRDGYNSTPKWSSDGRYLAFLKREQLWAMDTRSLQAWKIDDTPTNWFNWAPYGNRLAFSTRTAGLVIWNPTTQIGETILPVYPGISIENFAWNPTGDAMIFNKGSIASEKYQVSIEKILLEQDETLTLHASTDLRSLPRLALSSPDGQWVAFWSWDTESPFADEAGLPVCILSTPSARFGCTQALTLPSQATMSWGSDGILALIAEDPVTLNTGLDVLDTRLLTIRRLAEFTDQGALYPAWSPDAKRIAYSARLPARGGQSRRDNPAGANTPGRRIWIVDVPSRQKFTLTKDSDYTDELPLWSPDGNEILFARLSTDEASLWMVQANGQNLRQVVPEMTPLPEPAGEHGYIRWSDLWDWWRPTGS